MPIAKVKWLLVGLGILAAALLLGREVSSYVPAFASWVDSLGGWGPVVFVAGYIVATLALVPGSVLTLAGGALFGLVRGTLFVFAAATAGATLAFLLARYLLRGTLERRMAGNARFKAVDAAIEREGRKIVFLIRLSPLFPFSVTNYALGLTSVRLRDYVLACAGMLPGTILYVYYGQVLGSLASVVSGAAVPRGPGYWALLAAGLAATLAVTTLVTRTAKRALGSAVGGDV